MFKIVGVGSGAPEKFFDVVLRNVELLCILDFGAGRYSTATVIKIFMTSAHQCRIYIGYFQRRKNYGPGGWGPPECRGALVHCTTCTTYCYATASEQKTKKEADKLENLIKLQSNKP